MKKQRLRWKLAEPATGLRRIIAPPRSSWLTDGTKRYACVSALGRTGGWYWVAGWSPGVPPRNTCDNPVTLEQAKQEAMAYVKEHLAAIAKSQDSQGSGA